MTYPKHRCMVMAPYSGELRVSEVTHLWVDDIGSQRMVIRIRRGKSKKDRFTILSPKLLVKLRAYWRTAQPKPTRARIPTAPSAAERSPECAEMPPTAPA